MQVDAILFAAIGRCLTKEEVRQLHILGISGTAGLRIMRTRAVTIRRLQSIAGTCEDREALKKEADAAARIYREHAPRLMHEIERLKMLRDGIDSHRNIQSCLFAR